MNTLVDWSAQYLLLVLAAGLVVVWLRSPRQAKIELALETVLGLVVLALLLKTGSLVHSDPRPFVVDPSVQPRIPHATDNGFPSDHSGVAGLVVGLVLVHARRVGIALAVVAVGLAVARVAAHVHHVQDVVGGLVLGLAAAAVAVVVVRFAMARLSAREVVA